jgi:phage terminase large subunit-like protein
MNTVETLMRSGQLTHEHNPLLRWTFGNASIATNGSGLKKLVKETKGKSVIRTKRIDPVMALVLAMCRARFYNQADNLEERILSEGWGM